MAAIRSVLATLPRRRLVPVHPRQLRPWAGEAWRRAKFHAPRSSATLRCKDCVRNVKGADSAKALYVCTVIATLTSACFTTKIIWDLRQRAANARIES